MFHVKQLKTPSQSWKAKKYINKYEVVIMLKHKNIINEMVNFINESYDNLEEMTNELVRYVKEFKFEVDYNYYQYGNMLIYNYDIREFYKNNGYKVDNYNDEKLINMYKYHTRKAINTILVKMLSK